MKSLCLSRWRLTLAALGLAALAACGGGSSPDTGAGPVDDGSGAPAALSLTAVGSSARTTSLSWTPASGASGYTLERRSADSAWTVIATLGPAEYSYVDDGLAQVTTYTYRVVAQGIGATTAEQAATTTAHAPVVTEAGSRWTVRRTPATSAPMAAASRRPTAACA
ncbi:fibronectin type III domain-containing protein [Piscinibacter sp.]|uniref:fibronectin type III domain-containing protein n=1 Tax=Piscinibacter sp. TaxID=1903157 RepID=UPI002CC5B826|nr:fibronectin type III domain-containing protein [Albitalea sp.]HUG21559.1 fibronectin type III domain-containing protein [Albitalea sp.]